MHVVLRFASMVGLAGIAAGFAPAAASEGPTLLGVSRDWSAYQASTGDGEVCYALSKPRSTEPHDVARDPVYLMISDWPGRHAKGEFEIVPGYPYKLGEPVMAEIGSVKVDFFSRNDGGSGAAWIQDPSDEDSLRQALRRGSTLVITGVSDRGTRTRDSYSLSGLSAMLDKAHKACGL